MDERKASRRADLWMTALLCAIGLLINILGVKLALGLSLPLFLDCIGHALAAALGGYMPGIVVGFLTNLINGISDYTTAYYGMLSVLIAISAAWFARKGWFSKPSRLPAIIAVFALIGGGLGSVLTWTLYGFDFGTGISAPLARRIYEGGALNQFWSQFAADMLIDVADKTVTVLIVALVLKLLPEGLKARFPTDPGPLAALEDREVRERSRGLSLRAKLVCMVAAASLVIAVAITGISYIQFRTAAIEDRTVMARGIANAAARYVDPDRVDAYIEQGAAAEGYTEAQDQLQILADSSDDVRNVYACRVDGDGLRAVFGQADGAPVDAFQQYLSALQAGEAVGPVLSDGGSGWLLTVCVPVRDAEGTCRCFVCADVDMSRASVSGYQFLARVVSLFFGFFIIILAVAIWMEENNVIRPINAMAITAGRFSFESEADCREALDSIQALDIRTGDEIENLYGAVVKTTKGMVDSIAHIKHQGEVISRLQNGLILVLADMVESRDKCTGDHVRKTAAYAEIIMRQMKKDGIYADQLTEEYIRDVVNSAPLHDVGKIQVSDVVLNKNSRLTDEEYEQIKRHTVAGSNIITRAIDMVSESDSGFLREARNLALYHHEKWNGTGYPCGLKGEEIPLSARVMAVADVFDALVSKRSYKDGFPMEKAVGIIREGSGTHFDPRVVEAFLRAGDEIRRVMNIFAGEDVKGAKT